MKCLYLIGADDVTRDRDANLVSIHKIINEMKASTFPIIVHRLVYFGMLELGQDEIQHQGISMHVSLSMDTDIITEFDFPVERDKKSRAQVVLSFFGFPLTREGELILRLADSGGNLVGSNAIRVTRFDEDEEA